MGEGESKRRKQELIGEVSLGISWKKRLRSKLVSLGNQLQELYTAASKEAVLVAPFIKAAALAKLLDCVSQEINVCCVTRWRPDEIVSGVSDLEVWPLLKERPRTTLWLRDDLHAKFYRSDNNCLIGSANITLTALGWTTQQNLELLVPVSAAELIIKSFEDELFSAVIQVDQSIHDQLQQTVALLKRELPETLRFAKKQSNFPPLLETETPTVSVNAWVPSLRNPEELFIAYSGGLEKLSTASKIASLSDLYILSIPPGLSKPIFEAFVGSLLLQKPIIRKVDILLETPQRFGAVARFLSNLPCSQVDEFDADRAWQTLMRWLRFFLPNRYTLSVPRHSEVFGRILTQ